jgi:hypothetical protein
VNIFDGIQSAAIGIVSNTFGYAATWIPSNGGESKTTTVLFKDATEASKLLDLPYNPKRAAMEYFGEAFSGLKEQVDGNQYERVTVNGVEYGVKQVLTKFDGKTFWAELQKL